MTNPFLAKSLTFKEIADQSLASQSKEELFDLLNSIVAYLPAPPVNILEIGVHRGHSLQVWRKAFNPKVLIGVDNDFSHLAVAIADETNADLVEGDSNDVRTKALVEEAMDGAIDFLFLDGGHLYHEVRTDFELYSPLVGKYGVVAFHDIKREGPRWDGLVEVSKFWKEIKNRHMSKEIWDGDPESPGVGVLFL